MFINILLKFFLFNSVFSVIFNKQNLICYFTLFFLLGLEMILIKYLIDNQSLDIVFILGVKGIIGTIVFSIIIFILVKKHFLN